MTRAGRAPLFCSSELAARIERAEADLIARACAAAERRTGGSAAFRLPIAGGIASYADEGSPFNKVAGVGFDGVPSAAAIDEVERAFAERSAPVQFELAHLGDSRIGDLLTGRGYRLASFENVLGLALDGELESVTPPGVEVRRSSDGELEAWLDVVADGVAQPDEQGAPAHEEFSREVVKTAERDFAVAGVQRYSALIDGTLVGGASLRMTEGVAQLTGAATAPPHRRRGVHSALLSARLVDTAAAGCDVAVITAQPASKSQENAQKRGFDLLYTRAILVKEPSS
jgi:GNAT superfamily N-acetyltransferase